MTDAPDLAAMIAAVRYAEGGHWVSAEMTTALRAAVAVLEELADRECLAKAIFDAHGEARDYDGFADALRAALLARARRICPVCGGNNTDRPCAYPSEQRAGCLRSGGGDD